MAELRKRQIIAVIGASESGKSILTRYLCSRSKAFIAIDPSGSWAHPANGACQHELGAEHPAECYGHWGADPWELVLAAAHGGFQGTLVLDDADAYLAKRAPKETWARLFAAHRHVGVDVIMIARQAQDLPAIAMTSANRVVIFRMQEEDLAARYVRSKRWVPEGEPLPSEPFKAVDVDPWKDNRRVRIDVRHLLERGFGNPRGH